MASIDIQHSPFFTCLDEEITNNNIRVDVGLPFMVNGIEVTLDPDFEDKTMFPLRPILISDQSVVDTILLNQSDTSVAAACSAFLEKRGDYVCAESALKDHSWDEVNIEVTSWIDKKKENVDIVISSDSDDERSPVTTVQETRNGEKISLIEKPKEIGNSSGTESVTEPPGMPGLTTVSSKRLYRCSRCPYTHTDLKEVAAHQASSHLPARNPNEDIGKKKVAINISKVHCPQCYKFHIVGRYSCRNCEFETLCPMELETHMWQIHKSMHIYHCPCCSYISQSYMNIEEHLVNEHSMGKTNSEAEPDRTTEEKEGDQEKSDKTRDDSSSSAEQPSLRCHDCYFRSDTAKNMHLHISKYHNKFSCMPYMCLLCGKEAFNKRGLEFHSQSRHKHDPQSFALNSNSLKLMMSTTEAKLSDMLKNDKDSPGRGEKTLQWWCIVCGSGPQPYLYHLTPHLASHLFYMPYSCSECNTKFKLQLLATNHLKSSEKCWKKRATIQIDSFLKKVQMSDIELLRKAVELVDGTAKRNDAATSDLDMPYLCQICHFSCRLSSALHNHMTQHLPLTPYLCPVARCDEAFSSRQVCQGHIKKSHHVPDKTYEPKLDYTCFEEQQKLAKQLVLENSIHLPAAIGKGACYSTLLSCQYCQFGPCARFGLDAHMAIHSPYQPFSCPKCNKKFYQRLMAMLHVSEIHHMSDIIVYDQLAEKQKAWISENMKNCKTMAPDYSLKPSTSASPNVASTSVETKSNQPVSSQTISLLSSKISTATKSQVKPVLAESKPQAKDQVFQCKNCGLYSKSWARCQNHVVSTHMPQTPYQCKICKVAYRRSSFCFRHITKKHGVPINENMVTHDKLLKEQNSMAFSLVLPVTCARGKKPDDYLMQNSKLQTNVVQSDVDDGEEGTVEPEAKMVPKVTPPTNQSYYRCNSCSLIYLNRKNARDHFLMLHNKVHPYSCTFPDCPFESTFYSVVKDHVDRDHPIMKDNEQVVKVRADKEIQLKKCLDNFLRLSHSFRQVDQRKRQILKGSKVQVPDVYRAICIISSGRSCVYKCIKCAYTARSVDAFKKHLQDHLKIEQYRCIFCNYSCDAHIQRHIRNIHGSKDDDIVETKAYIMLVSQLEDLAREVLLLDEDCHRDGDGMMETGVPASMPEYNSICFHCKKEFRSLILAKKHCTEDHSTKQLRIEVELNFSGANADQQIHPGKSKKNKCKDDNNDSGEDDKTADEVRDAVTPKEEYGVPKVLKFEVDKGPAAKRAKTEKLRGEKVTKLIDEKPESEQQALRILPEEEQKIEATSRKRPKATTVEVDASVSCRTSYKCLLCQSDLQSLFSFKKHFIIMHTGYRPYRCNSCDFVSHDKYEVKRHGMSKHNKKKVVVLCKEDQMSASLKWNNFIGDWMKLALKALNIAGDVDDPKLDCEVAVKLEDISTNPEYAKYFS